jgi:ACS family hexuronate transporter-like MFS transporter
MNSFTVAGKPHRHRWIICALLFLATTCNYIDRQVLGILAPELEREFGWNEVTYGHIVTAFQTAYALGLLLSGWLIDRIGSRAGLAIAVFLWSLAAMAHGLARNAWHFAVARFGLGLAEAANFPASIKSVTEWFPEQERPFAIGIFNCGTNVGAIITPIIVPILAVSFGWQSAFLVLGAVGFAWLFLAWFLFRAPPQEAVRQTVAAERAGWLQVLRLRATWAFAIAKFLTDPVWWFYLYWTPKYLSSTFHLNLMALGAPLVIIYLAADVGSIGGGWWSSHLVRRGHDARAARLRVMLVCSIVVLSVMALAYTKSMWLAIVLLSLATAAHQGWSANLFASASSLVPRDSVASVIGCGGMAGAVGGVLLAETAGHVLEYTGSYVPLFCACASAYIVAWMVFRMLTKGAPTTVPVSE